MEFHKFCAAEFLCVLLYELQAISNSIYSCHKNKILPFVHSVLKRIQNSAQQNSISPKEKEIITL